MDANNNMTQKEQELAIVTPLLEEYGFTLIERKENERPDFVASTEKGRVVGIEVTELRDMSRPQIEATEYVVDQMLQKYTDSRKDLYDGIYSVGIYQDIIHDGVRIKPLEKQLFQELDGFISGTCTEGSIVKRVTRHISGSLLVSREPGHLTWVHSLPQDLLDKAVSKKAKKLKEYQALPQNKDSGINEYWLLIYIPGKEGWEIWAGIHPTVPSGYSSVFITDGFNHYRIQ